MPTKDDFYALYPGKAKARYNKAIRAELPGGSELLNLMELVSMARHRGHIDKPLAFAELIEDRLQDMRDQMVTALQGKYEIEPKEEEG